MAVKLRSYWWVFAGAAVLAVLLAGGVAIVAQRRKASGASERLAAAQTLKSALAATKPLMANGVGKNSQGTFMLAAWAAMRMSWGDVAVPDETSYAAAQKDIEGERGKRICTSGMVVDIKTIRTDLGKAFLGLQMSGGNVFNFLAVRSTEGIERGSVARFCGVVTELYDYRNEAGGTVHAVTVVGMFDLPENRR